MTDTAIIIAGMGDSDKATLAAMSAANTRIRTMDDLKPCPFCGGPGEPEAPSLGRYNWSVVCDHCGCEGPPRGNDVSFDRGDNDAEAIAAWNTRAADAELTRLRAENERLRRIVALYADSCDMPEDDATFTVEVTLQWCDSDASSERQALGEQP